MLNNLLVAIVGGGIYLAVGVAWSKTAWSHGRFGFDMGWLVVAVIVSRAFTGRLDNQVPTRREWFMLLWPCLPAFFLEAAADFELHLLRHQPNEFLIAVYSLSSCAFLLALLFWVMTFPYNYNFAAVPDPLLRLSRKVFLACGFAIAGALVAGALWITVATDRYSPFDQINRVELWLYTGSFLVYAFLALRMLFPFVAAEV